jgi:acyl-CoA dehydrogenase
VQTEELCWGDAGLYLRTPSRLLGGSAVAAAGTPAQRERFLTPFREGKPKWGAMAITEPQAGSDAAAIQTTAVFDEAANEWVLNGTKIFCTAGEGALEYEGGLVVVWATVDKSAGRAGIKSFVVTAGTPGVSVVGCEKKLGIRASDTATLRLENCRVPADNLLGKAEMKKPGSNPAGDKGFKGAMATFDASRPIVAAMAVGVGRAALDFVQEELERQGVPIRYDAPPREQTAIERDVIEMEASCRPRGC